MLTLCIRFADHRSKRFQKCKLLFYGDFNDSYNSKRMISQKLMKYRNSANIWKKIRQTFDVVINTSAPKHHGAGPLTYGRGNCTSWKIYSAELWAFWDMPCRVLLQAKLIIKGELPPEPRLSVLFGRLLDILRQSLGMYAFHHLHHRSTVNKMR